MVGYVKLHRQLLDSFVFANPDTLKVWIWCLLKANHTKTFASLKAGNGYTTTEVNEGEFVFGRNASSEKLMMNASKVYRQMQILEEKGNISIKSNNQYSVITILKWGEYQIEDKKVNSERTANEQRTNNKRTTGEQPANTYKNDKNEENDKNENNDKKLSKDEIYVNDIFFEEEKTASTESINAEEKIKFASAMPWPTFDDFWDLYEKKSDREKCEKKFKALSQSEKEKIMQHVPLYVLTTPDKKFRKDPATYLNNKSWNNEFINPNNPTDDAKSRKQAAVASTAEFLERVTFEPGGNEDF